MRDRVTTFARAVGAFVPDATAMAVFMIVALGVAALALGNSVAVTVDAFYRGLWMLLAFTLQMTLVLVLSGVVSSTSVFRRAAQRLAALPRSTTQVVLLSVLVTAGLSYLYWGLAVALGPLVAVYFARAAESKGIPVDFPCLLAAQFAAGSIWQYGLSSTPALLVATPGHFLEKTTGLMPLSTTIWSTPALVVVFGFPLLLAAAVRLAMPGSVQPLSAFPRAALFGRDDSPRATAASAAVGFARWSEDSRVPSLVLCACLAAWLWHHFAAKGATLDLNSMITTLLLGALLLTGTLAAFARGLQEAVPACAGVLVLYNLYGGVAGLLQYTTVGERLSAFFADLATPLTFPLLTALAGTAVAVFVPSSGGQWIIQGYLTTQAGAAVGASPQLGLLALGVGDQMGNLVSPFWMIVAAGIAGVEFRAIFGYSLLFAALWFVVGVAAFTFVPA
jgi:short-chain fatty acids transporter